MTEMLIIVLMKRSWWIGIPLLESRLCSSKANWNGHLQEKTSRQTFSIVFTTAFWVVRISSPVGIILKCLPMISVGPKKTGYLTWHTQPCVLNHC